MIKLKLSGIGIVFLSLFVILIGVSIYRTGVFDKRLGINLLFMSKEGMAVVSVRPSQGLVSILKLPDNLMIPVYKTGAEYTVEGYWRIGIPEKNPLDLTRESVARSLGLNIQGVIKSKGGGTEVVDVMESLWHWNLSTNLSLIDRYRLYGHLSEAVSKKNYLELNLPKRAFDETEEVDGKKVLRLNALASNWTKNQWVHEELLAEGVEILVINASGKEGLARVVGRQLETAGSRVVDLLTAKKVLEGNCLLRMDKQKYPISYQFILLNFKCQVGNFDIKDWLDRDAGVDAVMILGTKSN